VFVLYASTFSRRDAYKACVEQGCSDVDVLAVIVAAKYSLYENSCGRAQGVRRAALLIVAVDGMVGRVEARFGGAGSRRPCHRVYDDEIDHWI
jgi:hypothetical protein